MGKLIAILPGDGIGPEIVAQARRVVDKLVAEGMDLRIEEGCIGGAAYDKFGSPYPPQTRDLCRKADAVLFGAVGSPAYDQLPRDLRPERGLLAMRKDLGLFANLRPAKLFAPLASSSPLKEETVSGLDVLIVRELTGDIYFGQPRGRLTDDKTGLRSAFNTMRYDENEIRRIMLVAFRAAQGRAKKVCSVDKANVLETSELWREIAEETAKAFPDVALSHMYVDNAAMQLARNPRQFDVIVTGNLFGDILSDEAAMVTGSIGMLPSASLNENAKGVYEPIHGSAPDIAGKNVANPLATILSLAMLFRHSLRDEKTAGRIERAVEKTLADGVRTADLAQGGQNSASCSQMGDAVLDAMGQA